MPKISIITPVHITQNPRVWKEADALAEAGYEVVVIGVWFDPRKGEIERQMMSHRLWRYRAAADLRALSFPSWLQRQWYRLRSRVGRMRLQHGTEDPEALCYAVHRLLAAAKQEKADLNIVHLEGALWVGTQLYRQGFNIGVDWEDWYSENWPTKSPSAPEILFYRNLEKQIIQIATHATTTSYAMAREMAKAFAVEPPQVIYNSLWRVQTKPSFREGNTLKFLWFSQTLGPDRGLEDFFRALPHIPGNWQLEIRSQASLASLQWLDEKIAPEFRSRVQVKPTVSPERLNEIVAEHDVGFALEIPNCRNKDLTASNKIIQYLQSGLFAIASDTQGQREILEKLPWAGAIYRSGDIPKLARILNEILSNPLALKHKKIQIQQEANRLFAYEEQAPRLIASIKRALKK